MCGQPKDAPAAPGAARPRLPAGEWQHVTFTWDGTRFRSFLNGQLVGTPTDHAGASTDSPGFTLGRAGAPFPGLVDEVRVLSAGKSAAWVALEHGCTTGQLVTFGLEETR